MNIFNSQYVCVGNPNPNPNKNFGPKVVLGHCDLISCFSDFALYFDKQLVYFILLSDFK